MWDKCKGLRIGSLLAKNKAMLFRWVWRLGTSLWKEYTCKRYTPPFSQRLSGVWCGITSLLQPVDPSFDTIRSSIRHVVGNDLLSYDRTNYKWRESSLSNRCLAIQNKFITKSFLLQRRLVLEAEVSCNLCGIGIYWEHLPPFHLLWFCLEYLEENLGN